MSYCRFGKDSDVYVLHTVGGFQIFLSRDECVKRGVPSDFLLQTQQEVYDRLVELRKQGWKVPPHPFKRLQREINEQKH